MSLVAFWIVPPQAAPEPGHIRLDHVPLGLGVTAHDLSDALGIVRGADYATFLPDGMAGVTIREGIRFDELPRYVQERMGPIVVRGIWYPAWRPASGAIRPEK